jgi:hypothetical protein
MRHYTGADALGEDGMSGHSLASKGTQELCDALFVALKELLPKLQRNPTKGSCGVWEAGRTRFAYVYHSRSKTQIEVWCRGDAKDLLAKDPGLGVTPRRKQRAGWEESFPVRFRLSYTAQVPIAATFLREVSSRAATDK